MIIFSITFWSFWFAHAPRLCLKIEERQQNMLGNDEQLFPCVVWKGEWKFDCHSFPDRVYAPTKGSRGLVHNYRHAGMTTAQLTNKQKTKKALTFILCDRALLGTRLLFSNNLKKKGKLQKKPRTRFLSRWFNALCTPRYLSTFKKCLHPRRLVRDRDYYLSGEIIGFIELMTSYRKRNSSQLETTTNGKHGKNDSFLFQGGRDSRWKCAYLQCCCWFTSRITYAYSSCTLCLFAESFFWYNLSSKMYELTERPRRSKKKNTTEKQGIVGQASDLRPSECML